MEQTKQPISPANLARINGMFQSITGLMANLAGRWQDEKAHESIEDYA
jgi:hypothetical protein